jgi:hypothetical protein
MGKEDIFDAYSMTKSCEIYIAIHEMTSERSGLTEENKW